MTIFYETGIVYEEIVTNFSTKVIKCCSCNRCKNIFNRAFNEKHNFRIKIREPKYKDQHCIFDERSNGTNIFSYSKSTSEAQCL